jgi:hypothetical protein
LLQIPLQMQQNDNPEDGAPASGSRALRPGSFIGPMQQTRGFT